MKYIIVKTEANHERAILFDESLIHRDVARIHHVPDHVLVSAGHCTLNPIRVFGESESLGLKSRPHDLSIVRRAVYNCQQQQDAFLVCADGIRADICNLLHGENVSDFVIGRLAEIVTERTKLFCD